MSGPSSKKAPVLCRTCGRTRYVRDPAPDYVCQRCRERAERGVEGEDGGAPRTTADPWYKAERPESLERARWILRRKGFLR